ncbi:MAG: GNAT family N-acetyltransferase, partial [Rhodothermia bacterium]
MQTDQTRIDELTPDDRGDIIDVFVDAFHDYPVFTYILKDAGGEEYERHLRLLIGFFVDARLMRGWPVLGIREDGDLAAVILVSDPEFKPGPKALNAVYDELRSEVGDDALARLEDFDSASASYEPKAPTYFVGMVGVNPSNQGRGYGRMLMERVEELSRSRPESVGVT